MTTRNLAGTGAPLLPTLGPASLLVTVAIEIPRRARLMHGASDSR
ncbi:MAG TPA: hypothetical protein VKA73_04525 [Rubrobacter sp.]|nr:hypothetical protein [Rubrobacter sp.]